MIPVARTCLALALLLLPTAAAADVPRFLNVGVGTSLTVGQIIERIIIFLSASISALSVAMFVVGAFLITLSGVKEDLKDRGKNLMIGSVIALAIVAGAYAMLRTVDYFLS